DVDDPAAANLAHVRHGFTGHAHGAHEAQVISIVPVFVGEFHELAGGRAAGVIDDDVHSAEALCAVVNEAFYVLRLGHIRNHSHHLTAAFLANHRCGFVQRRFAARTDADLCTLTGKTQCSSSSHALARARYQRDFAF